MRCHKTGGSMQGKIALEEHFAMNETLGDSKQFMPEVWEELQKHRPLARNTVQTTMVRLEERGWLAHRDDRGVFRYRAAKKPAHALQKMVQWLTATLPAPSMEGLILGLLNEQELSPESLRRIKASLKRAEEQNK